MLRPWTLTGLLAANLLAPTAGVRASEPIERAPVVAPRPSGAPVPVGTADAVVDLATEAGAKLVRGAWRHAEARVDEIDFRSVGPDRKPTGPPNRTYDIEPHAGARDFDDDAWEIVGPSTLAERRGTGRMSFNWYRMRVTLPDRVGDFETRGSTVVLEVVVDDYAEVWVDGNLPLALGQTGGNVVAGFNAPNRVVVSDRVEPGREVQLAVFGINGPISLGPPNYIWVRSAQLLFYRNPSATGPAQVWTEIERKDPAIERIVPTDARLELVARGFVFTEGPIWLPQGALLFSDPNENRIYRYSPEERQVMLFRERSGYEGEDIARYAQPGSNGLTLDRAGRLTIAEHGNRRVSRLEPDGSLTVLAHRYQGKRLNSPNDLVYRSDGALYFTDPPFGRPGQFADPDRDLDYSGVFMLREGKLELVARGLDGPNGLAFSPDERFLYVTNWDEKRKVVMRYPVLEDGRLGKGRVLFDMGKAPEPEALDGIKVDRRGNLYVSGPGGLWILSAEGHHLGTIRGPEQPANLAWGDADGRTLYLTARTGLYRIHLLEPGIHPSPPQVTVERLDARIDRLIAPGARIEKPADGLAWVEGPTWSAREQSLYFTDIPTNSVFRWRQDLGARLFLERSGYDGRKPFLGREPGANGLALDAEGRLILCEHGNRRITRLEPNGSRTVLADRYRNKRLNSPNDLVVASSGEIYFTDPPFGLPGTFDDPAREIAWAGVYRRRNDGELELLVNELPAPNGLGFSPDGRTLYVSNATRDRPVVMAYDLSVNGTVGKARVFFDASRWAGIWPGAPDGIEVDGEGNVFVAGPGGVYVLAPDGAHLGTIRTGVATSNVAFGGASGRDLFITAGSAVYLVGG